MAEITAAAVKTLREKTDLPMMECKKALVEAGGDEAAAIEILKEGYKKLQVKRADNENQGRPRVHGGLRRRRRGRVGGNPNRKCSCR